MFITLAAADRQYVERWLEDHWKECAHCRKNPPSWVLDPTGVIYELEGARQPIPVGGSAPTGSKVQAVLQVVPVTCGSCAAISFLTCPPVQLSP
jgi:hypothetical protein